MQVSYNGSESLSLNKGPWSQYYWSKHINLAHAYCQLSMITMATLIYIQDHISPYMFSHIDQNRILSSFLVFANLTGDTEHLAATISFPFPNWWWLSCHTPAFSSISWNPFGKTLKEKQSAGKGEMYWKELEPQHSRVEVRGAVELRLSF